MGPTGDSKIVQIHPTRRCNLSCLHCYSTSSPHEHGMIDIALLLRMLDDAADEGYNVASISGGEPLLYPDLTKLLKHARTIGMRTTVTSNGMLLNKRRLDKLAEHIDLLAISLDGIPDSHNRMRGSTHAFSKMKSNLKNIRSSGINFGFIFTLTQYNANELEWVAQFAVKEKARLLQIHPLEETGRGKTTLKGEKPDARENTYATLIAYKIQQIVGNDLHVQVDAVNKKIIINDPSLVYADNNFCDNTLPLSEHVSPLIIEADGTVVPLQYGFSRKYAIGNLCHKSLKELSKNWRHNTLPEFRKLCRSVYTEAIKTSSSGFFNWFEAIIKSSHRQPYSDGKNNNEQIVFFTKPDSHNNYSSGSPKSR